MTTTLSDGAALTLPSRPPGVAGDRVPGVRRFSAAAVRSSA
ncbi:hypothetical protein [Microbacterium sp.]|nr:hypothetical protein [Microbacterium sp.]